MKMLDSCALGGVCWMLGHTVIHMNLFVATLLEWLDKADL